MFKLKLVYKSDNSTDGEYIEHESSHSTIDEAIEEANEIAFDNTGFNLETWSCLASFGEEGGLYCYYPNEGDFSNRYAIRIFRVHE